MVTGLTIQTENVTLDFIATQYSLYLTTENGTITLDIEPTDGTYDSGTVVELSATADEGYVFDGWSGNASGTDNPLQITMDADKNITALFIEEATANLDDITVVVALKVYPNPVKDVLNITYNSAIEKVEFYNVTGKKVLTANTNKINVSGLPSGVYLVKIVTMDGKLSVKKVIVD